MSLNRTLTIIFVPALMASLFCGCHRQEQSSSELEDCLQINEVYTTEVNTAGVRTVFQVLGCDGYPITDLSDNQVRLLLDGDPIGAEGGRAPVITQDVDFEQYALLLLDMSDSIVNTGRLAPMLSSARVLVNQLLGLGINVALYRFAGPNYFAEIQSFTQDAAALDTALNALSTSQGFGTTDLYGAIPAAVNALENTGNLGVLTMRSLVVFTDGSDEAMVGTFEGAKQTVDATSAEVFTVGLGGGVNKEELIALGKSGFQWAKDTAALDVAFQQVSKRISDITLSYYLVGVCSPRAGGMREMTIIVERKKHKQSGYLNVRYDATGFDIVGCDPSLVAFPCGNQQCGTAEGFLCGTCQGTSFCTDGFVCQEACTPDIQCGINNGVDCGNCTALGPSFVCEQNQCVDPCAGAECGLVLGVDCGDCSAYGELFGCDQNHICVDACAGAECGLVNGVDCGDCSAHGPTFGCDQNLTCVDACANAECGLSNGVDCGDCTAHGPTFGCDQNLTCVDACADAECGIVLGVDCGDCSELGAGFGCDQNLTCVDACADAECGMVSGVDCGDCSERGEAFGCNANHVCEDACAGAECGMILGVNCGDCSKLGADFTCDANHTCQQACANMVCGSDMGIVCGECEPGFECTSGGMCQPESLPGMTWVEVPGGIFQEGCVQSQDVDCDLDEQSREVELSSFWIMTTEVTLSMYQACIDGGGCDASQLDTGELCNSISAAGSSPDLPVNCIDWAGMEQFCAFISATLPTEAQWERAYRGNNDGKNDTYWIYPWGNSPEADCSLVVMNDGNLGCGTGGTLSTGSKPVTSFGLFDMAGNVAEWTRDYYAESYSTCSTGPCVNPTGPFEGDERVIRGGAFDDMFPSAFRTARRDKSEPITKSPAIGGRCVK